MSHLKSSPSNLACSAFRVQEGKGELREEGLGDRTADRPRGMEGGEAIRGQVGRRGRILLDQTNLRRARISEEVRQHGEGDDHEGLVIQPIHSDESTRQRIIPHSNLN